MQNHSLEKHVVMCEIELFQTLNQLNHCVAKWFTVSKRSNRITYRESFDSDRDFGAGSWIICQNLWLEWLNWMIRDPRYESWSEMMVRESLFKSVLGVGSEISWFRSELRISQNIWFRLRSAFCKSLIQFRASERVRKYFISDQKRLMPLMLHV